MNRVILTGRFTRDPESRMGGNSTEIVRFSLACQNDFTNRNGERDVEFVNCVAFGRTASTISKYCRKGQMISATGRIRNSSYDAQDGSKRYTTDIVIDSFEFMGSGSQRDGAPTNNYAPSDNYSNFNNYPDNNNFNSNIEMTDVSEDPYKDFGEEVNISSDDLPF